MKIAGSLIHLSETPGAVYAPARPLGQHTDEILKSIPNYSEEDIKELKRQGIIYKRNIEK